MLHNRCPYFSIKIQEDDLKDNYQPLRTPIYHCAATDLILNRLQTQKEGQEMIKLLSRPAPNGEQYPLYGPDLKPLSPACCTCDRCHKTCEQGFSELMTSYDQDPTLPPASNLVPH
jgi:hypothetical protein